MPNDQQSLILNVDDSEAMRYAKGRALTNAGFDVIEAATGKSALEIVERSKPALLVLDVNLPDISGIDVCKIVKEKYPSILVLQTSASHVHPGDRVIGLENGADSYLIQPAEPDELVATVRALLRLRRAENALRFLNETLEQRIEERTRELAEANNKLRQQIRERELAEEKLRHSQKMEAVGQLTGGIAHDFNNMLAVVIGGLNLAQRRLARGERDVDRFLSGAMEGANRAVTLTRRLLAFARQQPLNPVSTDLGHLIGSMNDLLSRSIGELITVDLALGRDIWKVQVDQNQLENAILNLAVNARDAMQQGGTLRIETSNVEVAENSAADDLGPGEYVLLSIADSGAGMDEATVKRAFEPFFTTKGVGKGTGLGLSQVFGFVRQSGGHVRIVSALNQGTTVNVYLPRAEGHRLPVRPDRPAKPVNVTGDSHEVIMLVEDDDRVRAFAAEALRDLGYTVVEAGTGDQAAQMLVSGVKCHLLVTDIIMPGRTGRQLAQFAAETVPDLKVLFMTGYAPEMEHPQPESRSKVLYKPFSIDDLAVHVRDLLDS